MATTDERWRPGTVGIGETMGPYEGEIATFDRWNGFACPRFTRAVAERIAQDSVKGQTFTTVNEVWGVPTGTEITVADYIAYRWAGDVLELDSNPEVTDAYTESYGPDDDGMYTVGAWAWTWEDRS